MTAKNRIDWHMTFLSTGAYPIRPGTYLWELPASFSLQTNDFEIGITALSVPPPIDATNEAPHLIISCDFVENEVVGFETMGILLSCNVDIPPGTKQLNVPIQTVSYTPINASHLNSIVLKFAYTSGHPYIISRSREIMATFHIRRIPLAFV